MVVTFKALLDERRQKDDGTYPLKVRVTVDRKHKEIPLSIYLRQKEWDKNNNRVKPSHPNAKLISQKVTQALSKLQEIALKYEALDKVYSVDDIVNTYLNKKDYKPTVIEYGKAIIEEMIHAGRVGNARVYKDAVFKLQKYTDGKKLFFEYIDSAYLMKFSNSMLAEGITINGIANYMSQIRALYNRAIKEGVVELKYYPFTNYRVRREATISRALSVNDMRGIMNAAIQEDTAAWHNRNYFMLSFCLMGISFADLLSLKGENIMGDRIVYRRKKTKKMYTIKLHPYAQKILSLYYDPTSHKQSDYLLPVMPVGVTDPTKLMKLSLQGIHVCNTYMGRIGHQCGITAKVTTYYSRYSWANIARSLGYSKDIIAQGLGHEFGNRVTSIYLDNYDNEIIDAANDKVINAIFGK